MIPLSIHVNKIFATVDFIALRSGRLKFHRIKKFMTGHDPDSYFTRHIKFNHCKIKSGTGFLFYACLKFNQFNLAVFAC